MNRGNAMKRTSARKPCCWRALFVLPAVFLLFVLFTMGGCGDYTLFPADGGTENSAPTAVIDVTTTEPQVGVAVELDGSGSTDTDGDTLNYVWSLTSTPADSTASLTATTQSTTSFTPDLAGTYRVQLIVDDGQLSDTEAADVVVPESLL